MKKSKKATSNVNHIMLGLSAILFGISVLVCGISFFAFQMSGANVMPSFTANYSVKNQKVYYYDKWIYAADPASFHLIGYGYARDKDDIFYDGRVVDGADYGTFVVISYGVAVDKNQVWIFDKPTGVSTNRPIEPLGNLYYRKGNQIFYQSRLVQSADADSFSSMSIDHMARDRNSIYLRGKKLTLSQ